MNLRFGWHSRRQRLAARTSTLAFAWNRYLGWPAWAGLALMLGAALVHWQVRPMLQRDSSRLDARWAALANAPTSRAVDASARPPLPSGELPSTRQRGRDLEWLVSAAQRAGLGLERADYSLGAATAGALTRVEATLPLTGSYAGVRRFVAEVLNELPHSALESLQIERATAQAKELQATARLVLFYSEESP